MLEKFAKIKSKKGLITLVIVAALGWAGIQVSESDVSQAVDMVVTEETATPQQPEEVKPASGAKEDFNEASIISPERRTHILYGDATGGGHLYGQGKPCKSEFPQHWSEETIIKEVELIAANDNLNWEQQRNGYHVTEQQIGTIKVRVVKDREAKNVITAYPTNVQRNPCPANDN